nr:hypothetical protein [Gynuella sunshinyii]
MNPALLWTLRIFIYATLFQALIRMYTAGVTVIWTWSIGAMVFALLLPIGKWKNRWSPYMILAVLIVEAVFAMTGMLLNPVPGVLQFAFFILLTLSAQLPRPLSILSYLLLLLMNHLPFVLVSHGQANWDFVFDLLPDQLVFIAFSEILWQSRRVIEENRKLIDELVEHNDNCTRSINQLLKLWFSPNGIKKYLHSLPKVSVTKKSLIACSWLKVPLKTESA